MCLQKPIFAPEPPASDDLSQFFEECRNPPNLDMFSSGNVMDINAALVSYDISQRVGVELEVTSEWSTELEVTDNDLWGTPLEVMSGTLS